MAFRHECTCAPTWTGLCDRYQPYLPSIFWGLITIAPAQCKSISEGASLYTFHVSIVLRLSWVQGAPHINFLNCVGYALLLQLKPYLLTVGAPSCIIPAMKA